MANKSYFIIGLCVVAITSLGGYAIHKGHDGIIFTSAISGITGIVGFVVGHHKKKGS